MNTTRYFKLGLFILGGLGLLVAGAVALGAARLFERSIDLETLFDESIAGLEVGAPVKHRGVTVGRVRSIRFPRESVDNAASPTAEPFKYILVDMALDPSTVADLSEPRLKRLVDQMVAKGLRARVARSGIAGSAYVELDYLDPVRYPVVAVPIPTPGLYVPSAPGAFNQVVDALTEIATKLQHAGLDQVVRHADSLIVHADRSVQDLRVAELRDQAGAILAHVQSASAGLQRILDDPKLARAVGDLPEITTRVRAVTARVDELVKNGKFDEAALHLRQTLAGADDLLAAQIDNVRAILTDLRAASANARELTEEVKSNPSRLFLGQPPARTSFGSPK